MPHQMQEYEEYIQIGRAFEAQGQPSHAMLMFYQATQLAPDDLKGWSHFANSARTIQFTNPNVLLKEAFVDCLAKPIGNHQDLAFASISLLKLLPGFNALLNLDEEAIKALPTEAFQPLYDSLFLALLAKIILGDASIEKLLTSIRQLMLEKLELFEPSFAYALAIHCFLNEYIYAVTEQEKEQVENLKKSIQWHQIDEKEKKRVALLGCYEPLYQINEAKSLLEFSPEQDPPFFNLIRIQIQEPLLEQQLMEQIPVLTPIQNDISQKVQQQYEDNPYPRWTSLNQPEVVAKTFEIFIKYKFPATQPSTIIPTPHILVAGCGTGQHVFNTANQFHTCKVKAFDLSRRSLAFAFRKAKELNYPQIEFFQADILKIEKLGKKFDLIESVGVLHHMEDTFKGWKVLTELLRPDGWMLIGLYSSIGRQDILAAREWIKQKGFDTSLEGIRQCRQQLLKVQDELIKPVTYSIDFFVTSACRDLLFHVHETQFTLLEIAKMLEDLKLEFMGFEFKDLSIKKQYQTQFPDDPQGISLKNWHQFEQKNPETFMSMYQFWVKKADQGVS